MSNEETAPQLSRSELAEVKTFIQVAELLLARGKYGAIGQMLQDAIALLDSAGEPS